MLLQLAFLLQLDLLLFSQTLLCSSVGLMPLLLLLLLLPPVMPCMLSSRMSWCHCSEVQRTARIVLLPASVMRHCCCSAAHQCCALELLAPVQRVAILEQAHVVCTITSRQQAAV
jgi:hypothetical protein